MRRPLLIGLAAVALLGAGALGARSLLAGAPPPAEAPMTSAAPGGPTDEPLPPAPLAARSEDGALPAARPVVKPATPAAAGRSVPVVAAGGAWESIPPATLRSWPTLSAALEGARPRLTHCYDEETQARYGPRPYSAIGAPRPGTGSAVLVIELEVVGAGRVRVVDAPVESRGASEDGLLSCVQEALAGLELGGPGERGARYRVRYPLSPMAPSAVASQQILAPRVRLRPRAAGQ